MYQEEAVNGGSATEGFFLRISTVLKKDTALLEEQNVCTF
jgi:hypothetical protein